MTEIGASRALPAVAASTRTQALTADMALKLAQSLEGVLQPGESAKAEVVSVKEQGQTFQLMLRLTLDSGRQTLVEAESPRTITQGTTMAVTALSQSRLIAALGSSQPPLDTIDLEQLPAGTLLQGKVASSQPLPTTTGQALFRVTIDVLDGALSGQKMNMETGLRLAPGSLLTARVDGQQSLSFLPLTGRLDQLEVHQQLANQQVRQGSLEGLFKALATTGGTQPLPAGLRESIDRLQQSLPDIETLGDAKALARALTASGTQFESRLLGGQLDSTDLKANLLRLVAQLSPQLPDTAELAAVAPSLPGLLRGALNSLGQGNNSRTQALGFPLPARLLQSLSEEGDLEALLKLAASALSRLQTHQLAGLAQSQVTPEGNFLTTWQMEIPMRNQQELVPLQLKLQQEESSGRQPGQERGEMLWRIDLAFDLSPLGPLQVQAQWVHGQLSSQLWAERFVTARLIEGELDTLRQRFVEAGLNVTELACRQGKPPPGPKAKLEQRWVDETA